MISAITDGLHDRWEQGLEFALRTDKIDIRCVLYDIVVFPILAVQCWADIVRTIRLGKGSVPVMTDEVRVILLQLNA